MDEPTFKMMCATAELMKVQLSEPALNLMADDLSEYSSDGLRIAFKRLRQDGARFIPSEIIKRLPGMWPGAEQAWASFPRDESQSACVCQEMLSAWGVADGLDDVAGRMAFKETYNRMVSEALAEGGQPRWMMTMGTEPLGREEATLEAVSNGLIAPKAAMAYLPHIAEEELLQLANHKTSTNAVIENNAQKLLSMDAVMATQDEEPDADPEFARKHLAQMMKELGIAS